LAEVFADGAGVKGIAGQETLASQNGVQ